MTDPTEQTRRSSPFSFSPSYRIAKASLGSWGSPEPGHHFRDADGDEHRRGMVRGFQAGAGRTVASMQAGSLLIAVQPQLP